MYKQFVTYIVSSLVEYKEQVEITEEQTDETTIIKVKVAPEDMGRIIGKEGRIIKSIREIVRTYSAKQKEKVSIEVVE